MNDYDLFLYIGILMLPTCIAQIIPRLKRCNTAPYSAFFFCICCNVGFGFLIYYLIDEQNQEQTLYLILAIVFLVFGYLPQIVPFSIFCCPTSFEGNFLINKEIFGKLENNQDFFNKLSQNRVFAPVITVHCEASHDDHYITTTRDSKGRSTTEHRNREVVTYRNSQIFRYNSWQEGGNPIRVDKGTSLIHCVFTVSFKLDQEAKNALNWLRDYMRRDALNHDRKVRVWTNFEVPGMTKTLCGTTMQNDKDLPCAVTFLSSCFGRFIFLLMTLIGYQSIIDAIWCAQGERLRLKLVKKISMQPKNNGNFGLRAGYLENDFEAAENTFHVDNLQAPLIPPNYQQPFQFDSNANYNNYMNSPYYQNFAQSNYGTQNENCPQFYEVDPIPINSNKPKQ